MKIIAFNVNSLRNIIKKNDLVNMIENEDPTILCMSETKLTCPIIDTQKIMEEKVKGYKYRYYSTCSEKGGYAGTAIFSKKEPKNIFYGLYDKNYQDFNLDTEGRVITLEFKKFFLVHVYTPNSGIALQRLHYRTTVWDPAFKKWLLYLQKKKPIIVCGDLNVANEEIDLKNPKSNRKTAGFTDEERDSFKTLLEDVELIDTYRYKYPTKEEYSYWTYRMNARAKNVGWRIDYFLVSKNIINKVKKSKILTEVMGSDHAPIKLNITFKNL
jgi:exodeoxyribonuclease-3